MTDDLTHLERIARAATEGPWEHLSHSAEEAVYTPNRASSAISIDYVTGEDVAEEYADEVEVAKASFGSKEMAQADATHIATFHPQTVLDLIERVRSAEGETDEASTRVGLFEVANQQLHDRIAELKAENGRLKEALEFYAKPENYEERTMISINGGIETYENAIADDAGDVASLALRRAAALHTEGGE